MFNSLVSFGDMNSKVVGSIEVYPGLFQGKNEVSCNWKIKPGNFFGIKTVGDFLKSPIFTCLDERNKLTAWQITVYPRGEQQASKYVSVYLRSLNSNPCEVFFKLMFFQAYSSSSTTRFDANQVLGYSKLMKQKRLCSFFNVDIKAQVRFIKTISIPKPVGNNNITEQSSEKNQELQDLNDQLVEDIGNVYLNDDLSDCKLVCGGQEISCHVVILAARSPVFAAMMATPLKERETKEICIDDFTIEIVKELVNFIYTGKVTNIEENAAELLKIADKYQIQQLKDTCVKKLIKDTNVENCLYHAELGILFRVDDLQSTAVTYAVKNITDLMKSQEWKQNSAKNPELLSQILKAIALGN